MAWSLDDILGKTKSIGDIIREGAAVYDDVTRDNDPNTQTTVPATTKLGTDLGVDADQTTSSLAISPLTIGIVGVLVLVLILFVARK